MQDPSISSMSDPVAIHVSRPNGAPCVLTATQGGKQVGELRCAPDRGFIEVKRLQARSPWLALALVDTFERILHSAGCTSYYFGIEPDSPLARFMPDLLDEGVLREYARDERATYYERRL